MITTPATVNVPLRTDEQGVIRIGDTRVTLQTLITDYQRGSSPVEIVDHFDALTLKEVYAVITYYLERTDEVNEYIRQQDEAVARTRKEYEHIFSQEGFKSELLARLEKKQQEQE